MTLRRRVVMVIAVAFGGIASAVVVGPGPGAAPADESSPGAQARRLAASPPLDFSDRATVDGRDLRAAAERDAQDVPLPIGGTFNGIQWEQLGDVFPAAGVPQMLEYNAACQWLRARRDGRQTKVANEVLATVSSWPAFRRTETGPVLADAISGGDVLGVILADCDAAHAREVEYARARGLIASS